MVSNINKATIWTSQNAVNKVLDELKSLYPKSYTYFEVHSFKYTLLPHISASHC